MTVAEAVGVQYKDLGIFIGKDGCFFNDVLILIIVILILVKMKNGLKDKIGQLNNLKSFCLQVKEKFKSLDGLRVS